MSSYNKLSKLNHEMDAVFQPRKLVNSATWMNDIRFDENQWYTNYHYEDSYFSVDGSPLPKKRSEQQASWAIQTAINSLRNPKTKPFNKAMSLRIILHVVGDIHQPLHSLSRVSKKYSDGDSGGNLYFLDNNSVGQSLHKYWDNGGGYLLRNHPVRYGDILKVARQIENKYPCHSLPLGMIDVQDWLQQSRKLAVSKAYSPLRGNSQLPAGYQQHVQAISEYQIALAGCRLAQILKQAKKAVG